jgi:hypothetical protein
MIGVLAKVLAVFRLDGHNAIGCWPLSLSWRHEYRRRYRRSIAEKLAADLYRKDFS